MKIVILYSGGLDSFLMYKWANVYYPDADIKCIFYTHGHDSEQSELKSLPNFVEVRNIDWLDASHQPVSKKSDPFAGNIYIPGRNLIFGALAACQELADEIWMGTVVDEDNPQATDKNEKFRHDTSELLSYVLSPFIDDVKIKFPFVDASMTKLDCVLWALKHNVTKEELIHTTSCWHNINGTPCGECKQCLKRMLVFGITDITESYIVHPLNSSIQRKLICDYITAYLTNPDVNVDELNMVNMISQYFNQPLSDIQLQMRKLNETND